jgi:hypothetical protein
MQEQQPLTNLEAMTSGGPREKTCPRIRKLQDKYTQTAGARDLCHDGEI